DRWVCDPSRGPDANRNRAASLATLPGNVNLPLGCSIALHSVLSRPETTSQVVIPWRRQIEDSGGRIALHPSKPSARRVCPLRYYTASRDRPGIGTGNPRCAE